MSAERQIPGGPFVNETGTAQRQIPGGPYINETVSGGATTYTLSAPTYVPGSITSTGLTARVTVTAA